MQKYAHSLLLIFKLFYYSYFYEYFVCRYDCVSCMQLVSEQAKAEHRTPWD